MAQKCTPRNWKLIEDMKKLKWFWRSSWWSHLESWTKIPRCKKQKGKEENQRFSSKGHRTKKKKKEKEKIYSEEMIKEITQENFLEFKDNDFPIWKTYWVSNILKFKKKTPKYSWNFRAPGEKKILNLQNCGRKKIGPMHKIEKQSSIWHLHSNTEDRITMASNFWGKNNFQ